MSSEFETELARPRHGVGAVREVEAGRSFQPTARAEAKLVSLDLPHARQPHRGPWELLVTLFAYGRVQLLFGLLFAVAMPAVAYGAHAWLTGADLVVRTGLVTWFGASITLTLGFLALRQIRSFPGVNSGAYVAWVFAAAYAVFVLVLVFFRVEYSRIQLLGCFTLTILWFLLMHYTVVRGRPQRLAVIPSPGARALPQMKYVVWARLRQPRLPGKVHGVVADLREDHAPQWQAFMTRCALQGLPIYDVKQVSESLTGRVDIEHLSENTLAYKIHATAYRKVKRALDTALVVALSPLIVAIVAVTALLVKIESPGPAMFRQMRMGHRGKPFRLLKLRTMVHGGETGERFTAEGDPRVTPMGRVLRKYRIDELPQAWNIFLGQMSWIGPRPEAVELAEAYERAAPFYSYRHIVRPGISGWAQVHQGNVAGADEARLKLQYDFFYLKNLSPWLDLVVIAKTVQTVLTGFGAR